ncbi:MAG: hypothetical protein HY290_03685 [Planctomycetia bacterium]|nr:hypothetical protein [Planctomycetia bacterium]
MPSSGYSISFESRYRQGSDTWLPLPDEPDEDELDDDSETQQAMYSYCRTMIGRPRVPC